MSIDPKYFQLYSKRIETPVYPVKVKSLQDNDSVLDDMESLREKLSEDKFEGKTNLPEPKKKIIDITKSPKEIIDNLQKHIKEEKGRGENVDEALGWGINTILNEMIELSFNEKKLI